jgi:hypothetical protein
MQQCRRQEPPQLTGKDGFVDAGAVDSREIGAECIFAQ